MPPNLKKKKKKKKLGAESATPKNDIISGLPKYFLNQIISGLPDIRGQREQVVPARPGQRSGYSPHAQYAGWNWQVQYACVLYATSQNLTGRSLRKMRGVGKETVIQL